jgi:hypothetical protein
MTRPSILSYQSPRAGASEERRLVAKMILWNGLSLLVLGTTALGFWILLFLVDWGRSPLTRSREGQLIAAFLGLWALTHMLSGIPYVLGSGKIHTPNHTWEHVLILSASILGTLTLLMTVVLVCGMCTTRPVDTFWMGIIVLCIHARILWRLWRMVRRVRCLR